jgi:peptidoglycan/LPS O-acetylase OafA/YrhL
MLDDIKDKAFVSIRLIYAMSQVRPAEQRPIYTCFDVLDFYRYAGALFVALDHLMLLHLPVDHTFSARVHLQLQPLMGFFFTLSGFVIMHVYPRISSGSDYVDYFCIYPLHLATLTFLVTTYAMFGSSKDWWFRTEAILPKLLLIHAWGRD